MRFEERVALVTGAGSGIGREVALALAREGADVIVNDADRGRADATVDEIRKVGRQAQSASGDVAREDAVHGMVQKSVGTFGRIDLLVNNAGIPDQLVPTTEQKLDHWQRVVDVHLRGSYVCAKEVGRHMIAQRSGRIVNVASVVGMGGAPMRNAYGPAKAGIIMLTRSLAAEWARHGIRVNAVSPGYVLTPLVEKGIALGVIDERVLVRRTPMGRLARPAEIAAAVLFLLSDDAAFVTGANLPVDGGWTAFGSYGDAFEPGATAEDVPAPEGSR
jgi:NAD(P)-dependent dehydrogenase (short-subunit alcohol dehydrogenase family)